MVNSSPSLLYESQTAMGATFDADGDCSMALRYKDSLEEHHAVRKAAGLLDLTHCGAIGISGREADQFLNALVTNNVKELAAGKGMLAAFLTSHGKLRGICRILKIEESYLILNDPQTHKAVFEYVFPFSFAGDFKVEDVSDLYRILSVQGPKSHLVMKEVCFEPVPLLAEHEFIDTLIAGHRAMVVRANHTGEMGFDIFAASPALKDIWDFILLKGAFHSIVPIGFEALDSLRIEAGIPMYGIDVDESNMMLEAALQDAVSFTKGCYTGQEPVAMATHRGHVSKRVSGLAIKGDTVPKRGDLLTSDEKTVGVITSAVRSPTLGSVIALGMVKYGFFEPGTSLGVETGDSRLSASVVKLPFYPTA